MIETGTRDPGPGTREGKHFVGRHEPEGHCRHPAECLARVGVAAGVLQRPDGRYLLAERPAEKHLGGYLEFPGGKLEPGEGAEAALGRELAEELGITVRASEPLVQFAHDYPAGRVRAYLYRVTDWAGEPHGREGQRLRYAEPRELHTLPLLPANKPILAALELPATLMVTPRLAMKDAMDVLPRLVRALREERAGGAILRLRESDREDRARLRELGAGLRDRLRNDVASLLQLNLGDVLEAPSPFTGLHLPAAVLTTLDGPPEVAGRIGTSVHNVEEARKAGALGLDYAVAGGVRETPSHPGAVPLGWDGFEAIVRAAGIPVYAIGGMSPGDVAEVRAHWGQGIAAIRAYQK